jgi:hypothetical protein
MEELHATEYEVAQSAAMQKLVATLDKIAELAAMEKRITAVNGNVADNAVVGFDGNNTKLIRTGAFAAAMLPKSRRSQLSAENETQAGTRDFSKELQLHDNVNRLKEAKQPNPKTRWARKPRICQSNLAITWRSSEGKMQGERFFHMPIAMMLCIRIIISYSREQRVCRQHILKPSNTLSTARSEIRRALGKSGQNSTRERWQWRCFGELGR